ncbi:MAG: hypothetical protein ACRC8S_06640 [Fimbriiglobus sp.]
MVSMTDQEWWSAHLQDALTRYSEDLLREVAGRLVKPRTQIPNEELIERCTSTWANPPVLDRRIRDLPESSRKVLAIVGLSRRCRWKIGGLLTILASLGHQEGLTPITTLLDCGLAIPKLPATMQRLETWIEVLGSNIVDAELDFPPGVVSRARTEDLGLPTIPSESLGLASPRQSDGLDWPLRLSLVRQQVEESPVRLTQSRLLFKRDITRLQTEPVMLASISEQVKPIPDAGILALFWATAASLLKLDDLELGAANIPESWQNSTIATIADLFGSLTDVEPWDPLKGYSPNENNVYPTPTAGFLSLLLLTKIPAGQWADPAPMAEWLWAAHPSWQGQLPKDQMKNRGAGWVEAWLVGVALPLRLIEATPAEGSWKVRLSDVGRWLFTGDAEPAATPIVPQSLLVQPNAEILAYRQGLTPKLIGKLSRFASWKNLGGACMLELTATRTYHGLESGMTLAGIQQTLNQHGMKPVPPTVTDLLRRWADKRERITIFGTATLVEFQTPADLDTAISRGIVSIRVTDRIALTDDGRDPDFKQLRLIGNRDYEAKPQQCLNIAADGITMTLDTTYSDLLFEAEVTRVADHLITETPGVRKFRLTPQSLRRAIDSGWDLEAVDDWFMLRAGQALPAAARLFLAQGTNLKSRTVRIVQLPAATLAAGLMQWPETAALVTEQLGPETVALPEENLLALQTLLQTLGITLEG